LKTVLNPFNDAHYAEGAADDKLRRGLARVALSHLLPRTGDELTNGMEEPYLLWQSSNEEYCMGRAQINSRK
jgi:hypothetical protein